MSQAEIRNVLQRLNCNAADVLRSRDAKQAGLSGTETQEQLIAAMAENPKLLQRPIGIVGEKAIVGRPAEELLKLFP